MSLETIIREIRRIPAVCSVCGAGGPFVLLPPLAARADRRCRAHLPPAWGGADRKSGAPAIPPAAPEEARSGAGGSGSPEFAGPGDLFGDWHA